MEFEEIYRHQPDCLAEMANHTKGVIIIPTGGGKSRIEFDWAKSRLVREDGIHQIVVIVAPRIILCQQLIANFYKFMKSKGDLKEMITFVSSGNVPTIEINGKKVIGDDIGVSTLDPKTLSHIIGMADKHGFDSVIFSTYKSFNKCIDGIRESIIHWGGQVEIHLIADEAHYFVRESGEYGEDKPFEVLSNNLELFDTKFFFTATPKVKEDGDSSGLNNSEVYGKVIYEIKPAQLIERGVICKPMLHSVILPNYIIEENFDSYAGDIVIQCFKAHENMINGNVSVGDDEIAKVIAGRKLFLEEQGIRLGGKMLVAVNGSQQLNSLIRNGTVDKLRNMNVNVAYTMSVEDIGTWYNGQEINTDELLKRLYQLCYRGGRTQYGTKLVVFHYDRLTEGIDVPIMTGMLPLREMNKIKKVQNIGRVLRALGEDQKLGVSNIESWIKPYSYIIVPKIPNVSQFETLMEQLEGEYDSNCEIETAGDAVGLSVEQLELQNFEHKFKRFRSADRDIRHHIEIMNEYKKKLSCLIGGKIEPRFDWRED